MNLKSGMFAENPKFRLTEDERRQVEENRKIVADAVRLDWWKWYMRSFDSMEDAIHEGMIRLASCVRTWDEAKVTQGKLTFKLYAFRYVRYCLRVRGINTMFIRVPKDSDHRQFRRLPEPPDPSCRIEDGEAVLAAIENADEVANLLRFLSPHQRDLVERKFGLNGFRPHSYEQLAAVYGESRQNAQQRFTVIRRLLRRIFAEKRQLAA